MKQIKTKKIKLITIKVTMTAWSNFKVAAARSGKTQYEISEEASYFVYGKYSKTKNN